MDDLKSIVIQSLEQEGTLSALKAQLRSRVFQAIEQNADSNTKKQVGFQWQNPYVGKIHDSEEALLSAHMIREYFDHYKMDYTQSVYMPEVALQHSKNFKECQNKPELMKKAGVDGADGTANECVMVQMIKTMRAQ